MESHQVCRGVSRVSDSTNCSHTAKVDSSVIDFKKLCEHDLQKSLSHPCERTLPPETRDEGSTENRSTKYKARRGFLWVGLRSRPDIMSTVGTAASMLVKNPAEALGLTKRHAYRPLKTDHVHTDASYAYGLWRPPGQGLVLLFPCTIGDGPDAHIIAYFSTRHGSMEFNRS